MMQQFRMDRTAFRINTFAEADNNVAYWRTRSETERLQAAMFLIRQAYNIAPDDPMRMDKTRFSMGKMDDKDKVSEVEV
jgi:hypothetical protein